MRILPALFCVGITLAAVGSCLPQAEAGFCYRLWINWSVTPENRLLRATAQSLRMNLQVPGMRRSLVEAMDNLGRDGFSQFTRAMLMIREGGIETSWDRDLARWAEGKTVTPEMIKNWLREYGRANTNEVIKSFELTPGQMERISQAISRYLNNLGTTGFRTYRAMAGYLHLGAPQTKQKFASLQVRSEVVDGVREFRVPKGMQERDTATGLRVSGEYTRSSAARDLSQLLKRDGLDLEPGIYSYVITRSGEIIIGTTTFIKHVELLGGADPVVVGAGQITVMIGGKIRKLDESTGHFRVFGTREVIESAFKPYLEGRTSRDFSIETRPIP